MPERKMSPVLKWAGGKTQLLGAIMTRLPKDYNRYYEPFIGSGAVFLAINPPNAVISDTNEQLINLYNCLKNEEFEVHIDEELRVKAHKALENMHLLSV